MPPANNITLVAAGAEGDDADIKVNVNQHLSQVLREALAALYTPTPDPKDYDIVIGGKVADLGKTVEAAGLVDGAEIAVLPKDVSRG